MCLTIATHKSKCPQQTLFYKVYDLMDSKNLKVSPLFYGKSFNLKADTVLVSNRKDTMLTKTELSNGAVHKGIHVCNTLKNARSYASGVPGRVIVAVSAAIDDFVAVGSDRKQTVFRKVKLRNIVYIAEKKYNYNTAIYETKYRKPTKAEEAKFFSSVEIRV